MKSWIRNKTNKAATTMWRCASDDDRKTVQRLYVSVAQPPALPVEIREWQTLETHTFVYDDWNLIHETIYSIDGSTTNATEVQYFWGLDLSDSLQGAGGVGGLLAVSRNGQLYFPTSDNNGNITKYIDESGNVVAAYEYDDFGRTILQSGPLADFFRHRFSTKYYDAETGLYYYGIRFSHPILMLWLNRDPLEEEGGINLYLMCNNNPYNYDVLGLWSATSESYGDTRRVYKKDDGDTIKGLAKKIEMDESTFNLWARVETKSKISSPNGGIPAPSPTFQEIYHLKKSSSPNLV
ncbi:MAG: RHS repeat-associated core domain-containing protein [Kiritimatiellae bacterium]|nr:RHS repeat-associated core domain-containing protein [Kiritimatiellia bacterium]